MKISQYELENLEKSKDIIRKYVDSKDILESDLINFEKMLIKLTDKTNETCNEETEETPAESFLFESCQDGVIVEKYIGFDEKKIVIPKELSGKKVVALEAGAFKNVDSISEVEIPNGVISIGSECFKNCINLTSVTFPESLRIIGSEAFFNTSLVAANIPSSVFYVGEACFAKTSIEKINLPSEIRQIYAKTFWCCDKLKKVFIPEGVVEISELAFSDCDDLETVIIPNGLSRIGKDAFCNCDSLREINLPNTVTEIEKNAFSKRYIVQPDRRYNPWTEYSPSEIIIGCFPASYAQTYARINDLKLKRCTVDYPEKYRKIFVYSAYCTTEEEKEILKNYLRGREGCEWINLNDLFMIKSIRGELKKKIEVHKGKYIEVYLK